jgi:hypothetical protein
LQALPPPLGRQGHLPVHVSLVCTCRFLFSVHHPASC